MLYPKFMETIEAVIYIAVNSGGKPVSSRRICEYMDITPRHLEPVMQALVQKNILRGTKGPKGGYSLGKEKRKITLDEIYKVVCALDVSKRKSKSTVIAKEIIVPLNKEISNKFLSNLNEITLEELCNKAAAIIDIKEKHDFNI